MKTTEEQINDAVDLLRSHGYIVTLPSERMDWETPASFSRRRGFTNNHFWRRTRDPECPYFIAQRGCSGRVLLLRSNPELERWMRPRRSGPKVKGVRATCPTP